MKYKEHLKKRTVTTKGSEGVWDDFCNLAAGVKCSENEVVAAKPHIIAHDLVIIQVQECSSSKK